MRGRDGECLIREPTIGGGRQLGSNRVPAYEHSRFSHHRDGHLRQLSLVTALELQNDIPRLAVLQVTKFDLASPARIELVESTPNLLDLDTLGYFNIQCTPNRIRRIHVRHGMDEYSAHEPCVRDEAVRAPANAADLTKEHRVEAVTKSEGGDGQSRADDWVRLEVVLQHWNVATGRLDVGLAIGEDEQGREA